MRAEDNRNDTRPIEDRSKKIWNQARVEKFICSARETKAGILDEVSDEDVLEIMGVITNGIPTLAGVMVFSNYPQANFPQLSITAVSLPGLEMGEVGDSDERFIDNKRITGAIPDMLEEAVEFVRRNSRVKTIIDESGRRIDQYEYPIRAVREAIINALVHRDYSMHTENIPIRIEMYRDRLEITNTGGLYGRISIDSLGKVVPETRNAVLTSILELLHVTENRYSGIPTMRSECEKADLPAPIFKAERGEFKVIMKNNIYEYDFSETAPLVVQESIVEYCRTPRSREEIVKFTGKSKNYVMSQLVAPLVRSGELEMTMPDKPKSSKQRFIAK